MLRTQKKAQNADTEMHLKPHTVTLNHTNQYTSSCILYASTIMFSLLAAAQ